LGINESNKIIKFISHTRKGLERLRERDQSAHHRLSGFLDLFLGLRGHDLDVVLFLRN